MICTHDDYTIAWICALPLELAAAKVMLNEVHDPLPQPPTDHNVYTLGSVSGHNVVLACLPGGVYGTISATAVASHMVSTFRRIRFGLMVGIGGGVPSPRADIRLGDVVISKPTATASGVIQYDYGKTLRDGRFQHTGSLNKPPPVLLKAVSQLESDWMIGNRSMNTILVDVLQRYEEMKEGFARPKDDWLFQPTYKHEDGQDNCSACDPIQLVKRPKRRMDDFYCHYGLIASGDQVMKDATTRDSIAHDLDILCFEMEAAGLMDELPSLAIRGICDYCDAHKNKQWQGYAALAAAAYTKALLSEVPLYSHQNEVQGPRQPVWMVPFLKNLNFVGREEEITRMEGWIMQQDGPGKVALCGLGGVGKTQIALDLAYRMRDRDPECSIFWITCTSYESVEQGYMGIASKLGMTGISPAEVKEKVKTYLSQDSSGKWLLLFDNADNLEMWSKDNKNESVLTDFLPQSEQGHILFTTRSQKVAVKLVSSYVITVTEPNTEMSVQILHDALIRKDLLNDRNTVIAFLDQLAYLPLAITQAAAYINTNSISLCDYLLLLEDQEPHVIELLSEVFEDERRYKDIRNPVALTWFISFQQIQQLNQLAADYLSFMACINPRDIPQSLLPQPLSTKKRIDAIGLLKSFSFVSEGEDRALNLHRLVHLATRNWMRQNQKFSVQVLKTADRLSEVFPNNNHTNRKVWREYLPHAFSLIAEAEFQIEQEKYIDLLGNIGNCLSSDGRWKEAEELELQVLQLCKQVLGPEYPDTLMSMNDLATTYWNQGRWKEAEELEIQVLQLRKQALGLEHPDTLTSMNNLATTYQYQGQWKKAEELEIQVLQLRKQFLEPEHPDTLTTMNNLASTYWNQGRWKEAEELEIQVLQLRKQVLGLEHPDTLTSMNNLASTYCDQGQWKKAEKLGKQALELHKQVLGPEHPNTLTSGQWKEAEELEIQVLQLHKQVLGPEHPDTLMRKDQDAFTLMEECHPHTISSSNTLRDWQREWPPCWLSGAERSGAPPRDTQSAHGPRNTVQACQMSQYKMCYERVPTERKVA
ncbi:violaceus kinesin [Aspergillus campestris IBT 28561]|uniref:Violaceus kinesin n=1 Tax=Aspergillus campestris (strain IBT 28561) TaxID=1392248 RepID=A0A2I1D3U5_ASPC2|nr:violaceus kinesin [Aspergillus campestris IBT 28561]PKY04544.1 violaceus kinesin [Aspergillus campestris IBT 28561]